MNLAIRSIEGDRGTVYSDTFWRDMHKDPKADDVLANPPFNDSDWHRSDEDMRWKYGQPPKRNANFACVQHFIHHLSPSGFADFVLANVSMSSNLSGEAERPLADHFGRGTLGCKYPVQQQCFRFLPPLVRHLWFATRGVQRRDYEARTTVRRVRVEIAWIRMKT
jgi:type I restriction enzyme M protein